ncbi:hypothetical protein [Methanimicrococcus hongohii]|uniref:hypothetical protein n=1 Tax=Methanimicrococcus hongohii TaxID=3028295 RepID=UPI00292FDDEA|nr:hypothetical protein [Methanimicrococcus sp. Hf6]
MTVFYCQLPAEPARLQLSFNVAGANQFSVSAVTFRFVFPLLLCRSLPAAAGSREPLHFSKIL